jgi:hypothetical protein
LGIVILWLCLPDRSDIVVLLGVGLAMVVHGFLSLRAHRTGNVLPDVQHDNSSVDDLPGKQSSNLRIALRHIADIGPLR